MSKQGSECVVSMDQRARYAAHHCYSKHKLLNEQISQPTTSAYGVRHQSCHFDLDLGEGLNEELGGTQQPFLAHTGDYMCHLYVSHSNCHIKINQIDAARLDVEMSAMLKEQLVKVFSLVKRDLDFLLLRRYGIVLPLLVASISGPVYNLFLLFTDRVILSRGRIQQFNHSPWPVRQRSVAHRSRYSLQRIEGFYKAASFSNLLIFLCTGRFRNLIERALKVRLAYSSPHMNRAVSFEYMNCQLVRNEFLQFSRSGAPDAVNQLSLCNGMVIRFFRSNSGTPNPQPILTQINRLVNLTVVFDFFAVAVGGGDGGFKGYYGRKEVGGWE
ncbi:hypothetical protein LguiB_008349 [Lonicera macranthoides]